MTIDSESDNRVKNNSVRHQYRQLSDEEKVQMVAIKDKGLEFLELIEKLPKTKRTETAMERVEEAVMWAVKSITA